MSEHSTFRRRVRSAIAVVAVVLAVAPSRVAGADDDSGPRLALPGFLLDHGRATTLEVPDAVQQTFVGGINDRGEIVGKYPTADNVYHGFLRSRSGRYSRIDVPGAMGTYATKINDRGQIVGMYNLVNPRVGAPGTKGFLLERGRFTTIDVPGSVYTQAYGINDHGVVVGEYLDGGGRYHGYRWERGRFTTIDVPGSVATSVTDINDHGDIVGLHAEDLDGGSHGFVRSRGVVTSFDAPGARFTIAWGINDRRQVVGVGMLDSDLTGARGFLATPGRNGPSRFEPVDVRDAPRTSAQDINDHRQIVGIYENVAAATPQPTGTEMPMAQATTTNRPVRAIRSHVV
jgi:uncharacterized membrane protein